MTDGIPSALCTVLGCTGPLHLVLTYDVPLYTVDPPWPGAGEAAYDAAGANTHSWEVVCEDGHTVWTETDQVRAANAAGVRDEDGEPLSEGEDWASRFDPRYLPGTAAWFAAFAPSEDPVVP